jgi:predicted nucleotidyltransferase
MDSTHPLLSRLLQHNVEFVLIGGMAAIAHGSSKVTEDVDVCAPFHPENLRRIVEAVQDIDPRYRMTPKRLPLPTDSTALHGFKNLYLITREGQLDILSEVDGAGDFALLKQHAEAFLVEGNTVLVMGLDDLIRSKSHLGRPKDRQVVAELQLVKNKLEQNQPGGAAGDEAKS